MDIIITTILIIGFVTMMKLINGICSANWNVADSNKETDVESPYYYDKQLHEICRLSCPDNSIDVDWDVVNLDEDVEFETKCSFNPYMPPHMIQINPIVNYGNNTIERLEYYIDTKSDDIQEILCDAFNKGFDFGLHRKKSKKSMAEYQEKDLDDSACLEDHIVYNINGKEYEQMNIGDIL